MSQHLRYLSWILDSSAFHPPDSLKLLPLNPNHPLRALNSLSIHLFLCFPFLSTHPQSKINKPLPNPPKTWNHHSLAHKIMRAPVNNISPLSARYLLIKIEVRWSRKLKVLHARVDGVTPISSQCTLGWSSTITPFRKPSGCVLLLTSTHLLMKRAETVGRRDAEVEQRWEMLHSTLHSWGGWGISSFYL